MTSLRRSACFAAVLLGFALLPGCAGFRGGWESVPYIGDVPPDPQKYRTPYEAATRSELPFPGVTVGVGLNNQLRTHDTQVYFFVLPLSVNPRDVHTQTDDTTKTRVTLRVSPKAPGFVFRPRLARLTVEGKTVQGAIGFEFGQWDAERRKVTSGGKWGFREVGDEFPLGDGGTSYSLSIDFPIALPDPKSPGIELDLSDALRAPEQPPLPVIRFQPARWKEGYT